MALLTLTPDERVEVRNILVAAFSRADFIELTAKVGKEFGDYEISGETYKANVLALVREASTESWIFPLLEKAARLRSEDTAIAGLLTRFRPRMPPPGQDPFEACRLGGDYMMVNRSNLRAALRNLETVQGKRVLVVRDEVPVEEGMRTKTGKTHTIRLISFLHATRGGFEFAWIDLEKVSRDGKPENRIQPDELARRIFGNTGGNPDLFLELKQPPSEQWPTWINNTFLEKATLTWAQDKRVWWVVIDINGVLLPTPSWDLLKALAARITVNLPRMRLILLGFREVLAPDVMPAVHTDHVGRGVSVKELAAFYQKASLEKGVPPDARRLGKFVADTLAGLDPQSVDYLTTIETRVAKNIALL